MTGHRRRAVLFTLLLMACIIASACLWLRAERRQYALDRELITALVTNDAQKALVLVNSGADPNTPCHTVPPPSLRQLWNYLLRRSPLPTTGNPTAFLIACGASPTLDDGTPILRMSVGPYEYGTPNPVTNMDSPGNPQLVEAMLQHGGNIDARDQDKRTPLMWAASAHYPKTVGVLLEHKVSVNAQDGYGSTALYLAVEYSHSNDLIGTDIVRQLLAHGADPNLSRKPNPTILQLAQVRRPDLVALLRRAGAKK
jgi:ankyrin repeat protein